MKAERSCKSCKYFVKKAYIFEQFGEEVNYDGECAWMVDWKLTTNNHWCGQWEAPQEKKQ